MSVREENRLRLELKRTKNQQVTRIRKKHKNCTLLLVVRIMK